ncbi:hypothetical protein [Anaerosporobacter faecicola]|uniref:hypothetical protein n=1 Tax=Anaerosporobacter faecicola TaxID=2718714 RepID=UPI001438E9DB|nr:hypothetical protein [Anaerosporobacter faecicola]
MIQTFKTSYQLKNTYRTNGIIYSLKSIPLIKKLLPADLYASKGLQTFALVVSSIYEAISVFVGKFLYLLLMIYLPLSFMQKLESANFIHIVLVLTVLGGMFHADPLSSSKDKYYAIILMRMNAKKYTISNYIYFLIKLVVGFLPFIFLFGKQCGIDMVLCLLVLVFIIEVKLSFGGYHLFNRLRENRLKGTKLVVASSIIGLCLLVAAYLSVYLGYVLPIGCLYLLCALGVFTSVIGIRYMCGYSRYREAYKALFFEEGLMQTNVQSTGKITQKNMQNKIQLSADQTSSKEGYGYFNELFMKRHSRLLTKSAIRYTVCILIVFVAAVITILVSADMKKKINESMFVVLPTFLFVMYFVNRGKVITEAMFMNCDHSMLTYRFYRQPSVILRLFITRLKMVIRINLIPASVIAVGLPILLFLSGGTDHVLNYFLLFGTIIAMSVFFSVHNMVLYYLLQPYNINIEMKNPTYTIINSITYFICYLASGKEIPTVVFGTLVIVFCVVYVIVAMVLAYRLAPKTFRLRQ